MLTRRELVKCGVTAATLSGFSPRLVHADDEVGRSPFRTDPFVEPLPFPPVKEPVGVGPACRDALSSTGFTQANPGPHQYIERADCVPTKAYEIHVAEGLHSFHPSIPPTKIFGYDGISPGPTFKAFYGEPIMVRFFNELPADHVGFGRRFLQRRKIKVRNTHRAVFVEKKQHCTRVGAKCPCRPIGARCRRPCICSTWRRSTENIR